LGFSRYWWASHPIRSQPSDTTRKLGGSIVAEDDVEREFWRLTEDANDTVEIEYGADVHSTTHGRYVVATNRPRTMLTYSGSPSMETHPLNPYSRDGWNLNNMPILPES
jgi:histone demethylase JARID1